jgi:GT2 family glycosyltransferase
VPGLKTHIVLVDDGSTDGTAAAVLERYPETQVIRGDGRLFWAGGMRLAFREAVRDDYDFYLFLNDDTIVDADALVRVMSAYAHCTLKNEEGTVVGATRDPVTGEITYGGLRRTTRWRPLQFALMTPGAEPVECDTMNTNFVLIPRAIAKTVGNLDEVFTHRIADIDYGLRVRLAGFHNWVMPGTIGACGNDHVVAGGWLDESLPLGKRLRHLMGPKGLSLWEWGVFTRRHAGPLWLVFWLAPYARVLVSALVPGRPRGSA